MYSRHLWYIKFIFRSHDIVQVQNQTIWSSLKIINASSSGNSASQYFHLIYSFFFIHISWWKTTAKSFIVLLLFYLSIKFTTWMNISARLLSLIFLPFLPFSLTSLMFPLSLILLFHKNNLTISHFILVMRFHLIFSFAFAYSG